MNTRFDFAAAAPDAYKAVSKLEHYVSHEAGLDIRLLHLIKIRASQINGCAFCVDMHIKEARADGLPGQWIDLLAVWRESPLYDARERAVLAWVDCLTNLAQQGAPDAAYEPLRAQFSEAEIARLTVAIGVINTWNRLVAASRRRHPIDGQTAVN